MRLSTIFSDGVVLQRDKQIPVWGFDAVPGALISAELAAQKIYCRASADGSFMLRFAPVAAGTGYTLIVQDEENGGRIVVSDVLCGEVWFASGQSNMEYELGADLRVNKNLELNRLQMEEFLHLNQEDSMLRMFRVKGCDLSGMREKEYSGSWSPVTAETAKIYSAVGAWFAYYVKQKLNVPVGIVVSAVGGTCIEAWTSREMLMLRESGRKLLEIQDGMCENKKVFLKQDVNEYLSAVDPGNTGVGQGFAEPDFDDSSWHRMYVPGSWIRQGIAGNGAVWVRCKVTLPSHWAGREITLHLGSVDKHDITYFNGVEAGRTGKERETCWHSTPRAYKIAPELVRAGENTIAVRAFSFIYDGALGNDETTYFLELNESGERIDIAGKWRAECEFDWGCCGMAYAGLQKNAPGILFDNLVAPVLPFAIRGFLWYQGESNSGTTAKCQEYKFQMADMIRDWRFRWGSGDLPFIMVMLAGHHDQHGQTWAQLRGSQMQVCREMEKVYAASAVDIGDSKDIHPQNKKDVGCRMAKQALNQVYGFSDIVSEGPRFSSAETAGSRIIVTLDFAENLHFADGVAKGFYLAGADGVLHFADQVTLENGQLVAGCSQVAAPVEIRYNWYDMTDGNLYNGAGLPCAPFCWQQN